MLTVSDVQALIVITLGDAFVLNRRVRQHKPVNGETITASMPSEVLSANPGQFAAVIGDVITAGLSRLGGRSWLGFRGLGRSHRCSQSIDPGPRWACIQPMAGDGGGTRGERP